MSLSQIEGFDIYIKTELGLSGETISAYTRDVEEFLMFIGDNRVTGQFVEQFVKHMELNGLKPTTVRRKCMSVRCLCHHLISLGKISENTLNMIDPIRIERKIPNALGEKDVYKLLDVIRSRMPKSRATNIRRDVAIVLTLYNSGLRASELCNLDLPDVSFENRLIKVSGKGNHERVVPTTIECATAIRLYVETERKSQGKALFVKSNGQRVTRRSVSYTLTSLSHKARIPHTTSHMLRRSCATSLMNNGVDVELVQSLLGHKSLDTTQSYLAVSNEKLASVHKQFHPFGDNDEV